MGFGQAVGSVLRQYATFRGRARRSEYWWFSLFMVLVYVVAVILDAAANTPAFVIIALLGLFLPGLAVTVRRLHDTSRSGAWIFISLVPLVGGIVLLVFECQDSTFGSNSYGPSPKYAHNYAT